MRDYLGSQLILHPHFLMAVVVALEVLLVLLELLVVWVALVETMVVVVLVDILVAVVAVVQYELSGQELQT